MCSTTTKCKLTQTLLRHAFILGVFWLIVAPGSAYGQQASAPVISAPVTPLNVTVDPKSLQPEGVQTPMVTVPEGEPLPGVAPSPSKPILDPVIQLKEGYGAEVTEGLSDPEVNIPGITSAANPPDTVGDVGRDHFVQMVNATQFRVWDKKGNALTPALVFGNLWPVGDVCRSNAGDPIVVYDHLADRWLLSQFANPSHMCIAISQTSDPTVGTWFLYTFNVGVFPDYPKFGVWPDGYYMSSFEGNNLGVFVFQRDAMLLGQPAIFMKTTISSLVPRPGVRETRILPSDLDGQPPPEGTPNFFTRTVANQQDVSNPTDRIEIYEARVDWATPSFAFSLINTLTPEPFNVMVCNRNGSSPANIRDCIPQPDTTSTVDALSNRPMMQLKYRNFGSFEAMVFNQTIDVRGSMPIPTANEVAGIRWYELQKSGVDWTIRQQGTFAPQPSDTTAENQLLHRWMGSTAMDRDGNIALGYSVVNDDDNNKVFPSIRYTGRYFDDPLGLLLEPERTILNGTNSQTGGFGLRWGDYSALSVDPVDDCTFWYTNHVAGIGGTGPRPTRIASFRFATCAVLINDLVSFEPLNSTFQTTTNTSGCPTGFVGKFSFDARLSNNSSPSLSNLVVKVVTLTNGNLLQNADGGPGGAGSILTVAKTGSFADGVLSPGEFVDVPFSICLKNLTQFDFLVDVLGASSTTLLFDNGLSSGPQSNTANDLNQRLYEDFTLSSPSVITGFSWQQHDQGPPFFIYQATRIEIYAGLPEVSPRLFSADIPATREPNGAGPFFCNAFGCFTGFDYTVDGLSIVLPPGTYSVGLNTIAIGPGRTAWTNTTGASDTIPGFRVVNMNFPAPGSQNSGNLAFQVRGHPATKPLPEIAGQ